MNVGERIKKLSSRNSSDSFQSLEWIERMKRHEQEIKLLEKKKLKNVPEIFDRKFKFFSRFSLDLERARKFESSKLSCLPELELWP